MIDISTLRYRIVVVDNKKNKYNITDYLENLGWQENEGEISTQITFTVRNDKTSQGYLTKLIKPGVIIIISAKHSDKKYQEVARGNVVTWSPTNQNSAHDLRCVCFDELNNLQKSQDNFYFRKGMGTKARIKKVLKKWKIPVGSYQGPNKSQGKKRYQGSYLSDILLDILDDAEKKGGKKYIIQMKKGKVTIAPRGNNSDIYVFEAKNTKVVNSNMSSANLITRVKVIGKSKKKSKTKVVSTVNGKTKYGVRQRIYTGGPDETLKQAKKAAKQILEEAGDIQQDISVKSPDVPYIRKGDMVYMKVGSIKGYHYVKSVQHDADSMSMTMNLESAEKKTKSQITDHDITGTGNTKPDKSSYKLGDVVYFKGGTHYVSSTGSKGYSAKAGKAEITKKNISGKHPYHLIHTNSKSNVYGWVDKGTFS
ncbi:MAG: hypothetical protein HFG37_04525 [Eubacterium sp.]|nr:hypothetical protein [Eubacterium sp.]